MHHSLPSPLLRYPYLTFIYWALITVHPKHKWPCTHGHQVTSCASQAEENSRKINRTTKHDRIKIQVSEIHLCSTKAFSAPGLGFSTKWRLINSFFSSQILIFQQYLVSKIPFYHTILQASIRRHPGLEL